MSDAAEDSTMPVGLQDLALGVSEQRPDESIPEDAVATSSSAVCVLADVHLGSLLFDGPAFQNCIDLVCDYLKANQLRISHLVLLGETIDRAANLPGQALRGISEEWQVDLAASVVRDVAQRFQAEQVDLVGATRELRKGSLQHRRLADRLLLSGVKATYSSPELKLQVDGQQVIFTHSLGKRTSGSYAGVVTPLLLTENLMKTKRLGADLVVAASYRKYAHSNGILCMPGFILDIASEIYNERAMALLLQEKHGIEVKLFRSEPTRDHEELGAWNLVQISDLLAKVYPHSSKLGSQASRNWITDPKDKGTDCEMPNENEGVRLGGRFEQVHAQLPTTLMSELKASLRILGYASITEWMREKARQTVQETRV